MRFRLYQTLILLEFPPTRAAHASVPFAKGLSCYGLTRRQA